MADRVRAPLRLIHSRAPLRANDLGGWTDTWFAKEGCVLNLAFAPSVEVEVKAFPNDERAAARVLVRAENYGETFVMDPARPSLEPHGFLQHTIATLAPPETWRVEVNIYSPVPAGISTGTSASICVALLGAFGRLAGRDLGRDEVVSLAHGVETVKLKQQSGIQDQICAAHGGISFIEMPRYPDARVERLELPERVSEELGRRLLVVYLGRPHSSSAIHEQVIARLESGEDPGQWRQLETMKRLAREARDHLLAGDLEAYGKAMSENTECQRALFDGLVSSDADAVIDVCRRHGASGWKVNGAGGQGGSLALLAGADDRKRHLLGEAINALGGGIRTLPAWLSPSGLTVWEV
jgi:D-glycero-alpha-D-manno-heptose-7-phosphate kinase